MKINELRSLSAEDLIQKEKIFRKELFELNQQRYSGRVDKPARFRQVRKTIARIQTLLRENKEHDVKIK